LIGVSTFQTAQFGTVRYGTVWNNTIQSASWVICRQTVRYGQRHGYYAIKLYDTTNITGVMSLHAVV